MKLSELPHGPHNNTRVQMAAILAHASWDCFFRCSLWENHHHGRRNAPRHLQSDLQPRGLPIWNIFKAHRDRTSSQKVIANQRVTFMEGHGIYLFRDSTVYFLIENKTLCRQTENQKFGWEIRILKQNM